MAAIQLKMFYAFPFALFNKKHDLENDTIFVQLMNTEPDLTGDSIETDLPADLGTGNGYTAGGVTAGSGSVNMPSPVQSIFVLTDLVITASGGNIGPFRYIVLLNNTATDKNIIGYLDYGSSITLTNGQTLTLDFSEIAGLFGITINNPV